VPWTASVNVRTSTKPATILVVEDDRPTAHLVELYLKRDGHRVLVSNNGRTGLETALAESPDLIILDIMLPGLDGIEFCRKLRQQSTTPIIFLTARSTESDKLFGLDLGGDDYVTKQFSPGELAARARAILRRLPSIEHPPGPVERTFGELTINFSSRAVRVRGQKVELTPLEYRLLCILVAEPGRCYTRPVLIELAFGADYEGLDRSVDVHIKNLRRKVEPGQGSPLYIQTVFGVGYRFNPEITV
jgi:two-component system, OmpR family, alkaline phosphatase synthesis response regulator PhoP